MKELEIVSGRKGMGLALVPRTVCRVEAESVVREATTGRVVFAMPETVDRQQVTVRPQMVLLPRVWAVAETTPAQEPVELQDGKAPPDGTAEVETDARDGVAFYRKYTEGMLRRYVRLSMEAGRVPSLLGRELFRGKVTSYKVTNFEDVVIFCFDMERLLLRLRPMDQRLIKRVAMQEYTQVEVASMMRISRRNCIRMYTGAVDRLTEMLLEAGMLEPLKSCQ